MHASLPASATFLVSSSLCELSLWDFNYPPCPVFAVIRRTCIELELLVEQLDITMKGGVVILLLDACRENPSVQAFKVRARNAGGGGAKSGLAGNAGVSSGKHSTEFVVGYAADPGTIAIESARHRNGFFTAALLSNFSRLGNSHKVTDVLDLVRAEVQRATAPLAEAASLISASVARHGQRPWVHSCVTKRVFMFGVSSSRAVDSSNSIMGIVCDMIDTGCT